MKQLNKIRICLFLNVFLLGFISFFITFFAGNSKYFRFGPNSDFVFISVTIDTYDRYFLLLGLIGLNNIPKLLSIEPYDPSFINGRGFINQFQIIDGESDTCISSNYEKQIKNKINATKHESVKEKRNFKSNVLKKNNFANLVKSNARNKLSLTCLSNLNNNQATTEVNYSKLPSYTPFKLFKTGKGHYLGP